MNAVEVKNLTKNFEGFTLDKISFTLPCGCIMGLIGENGAGKSTTLKLLLGMLKKDGGEISILGKDENAVSKDDIGVVFDECRFHDAFTPKDINKVLKNVFNRWNEHQFFDYLKKFEVPADRKIKDLSRGMKMKISIAAAISHNAKLLLLDEPTSTLDPVVRDEILDIFYDFISDEEHSILISSHIVSDLEKICDYIVYLHKGKVAVAGEKDLLLEQFAVYGMDYKYISELDKNAVVRVIKRDYGADILAHKAKMPKEFSYRPASLDDFMLFFSKGEEL